MFIRLKDTILKKYICLAFVLGEMIQDHFLLACELLKSYTTKGGVPRCMIRMDIQKTYDTVNWQALETILR